MRKTFAIGIAGLFAVAALPYWVWKTQYDEQRVIDHAPLTKHMENFVAKYRREECLMRLDFVYSGDWSEDMNQRIFRNLVRFVAEERPQMGLFWWTLNPATGQMFVQFADDCPNRFEHMQEWARRYARRHGNPSFTVSNDRIKPGPDTLDHQDDAWLD